MTAPLKDPRPLVVYVDDEIPNRLVFQATFGQSFNVKVCESVEAGLKVMQGQTVAVVLADQRMPNATGVDLLTKVKELYPDAIRILVTAYTDQEPIVQAVNRVQIDRFIPKPWDNREMEALLYGAIDTYHMRLKVKDLEFSLISAQRAEVLGRVAAELVHDMASPLAAITANVERLRYGERFFKQLAEEKHNGDEEQNEILAELPDLARDLEMSTQYLTQLVNGIREHWRPTQADGEADVKAVIEFAKRLVQGRARQEKVTLKFDAPDVPKVKVAPSMLCQVVTNLIVNSIQAFNAESVKRDVSVSCAYENDGVAIVIADSGKGIAPEVLARLGREQLTTKVAGQGTGLGVMITRTLVEKAGGRFVLSSTVGQGTTARVWLPIVGGPKAHA
ncbi:MAG: hybrid sensor histidine kinase/response regulator [Archangiaceae bacterium]|nr:hybrid sensor histidine kinase/response regulator [Archangiaceae bacterium]